MRRAIVLVAVLVVVAISALVGSTVIYVTDAEMASSHAAARREQSRLLAWSGVQMVMSQLEAQREELLMGGSPRLTDEWEASAGGSGASIAIGSRQVGVIRLRKLSSATGPATETAASEAARVDINSAPASMLGKLPGCDPAIAAKIVTASKRGSSGVGHISSVAELAASGVALTEEARTLVTTTVFDPNVQIGLRQAESTAGAERDATIEPGARRIDLTGAWSDDMKKPLEDRFGEVVVMAIRNVMTSTKREDRIESRADLVKALRATGLEPRHWPVFLDAFTSTPRPFVHGQIDVMRAPEEVLSCVPGIDADAAARIVRERATIGEDDDRRFSICWLVLSGVLTEDQFQIASDHLTMRTMQWRVIVEAGVRDTAGTGEAETLLDAESKPLLNQVVIEAVIDVAGTRPRVAYMRDITLLPVEETIARIRSSREEDSAESRWRPEPARPADPPVAPAAPSTGERRDVAVPPERAAFRERASRPDARGSSSKPGDEEDAEGDDPADQEADDGEQDTRQGRWRVESDEQDADRDVDSDSDSLTPEAIEP